jgi:nucleoside-diphosphate kinase
MFLKRCPF